MKEKKLTYIHAIKILFTYIKSYRILFLISSVLTGILIMINLVKSNLIQYIINGALSYEENKFITKLIIFVLVVLIGTIISYLTVLITKKIFVNVIKDIKYQLANQLAKIKYQNITDLKTGDLVSRLNHDTTMLDSFLKNDLPNLIMQFLMFVIAFTYVLIINYRLVLISFILTPFLMFLSIYLNKKSRIYYPKILKENGESIALIEQNINGIEIIKSYNLPNYMIYKFNKKLKSIFKNELYAQSFIALLQPTCFLLSYIPRIICLFYGGYLVVNGRLDTGMIVAFMYIYDFIIGPTVYFPFVTNNLNLAVSGLERIHEILNIDVEDEKENSLIVKDDVAIICHDLSFKYNNEKMILNNLNLKINNKQITAIVGESGMGKTTLINLIVGLYSYQDGSLKIFGQELKELDNRSVRDNIAFVSQDAYLFTGTILENLRYGKESASLDEVIEVCIKCKCHDFIIDLKDKYETIIGEGNIKLSGGQMQRITLARAIIKDSPIILLDEPTSALDEVLENDIKKAIEELSKNKAIIVITHRINTIINAQTIYVLKDGEIVEQGNHEKLVSIKGHYYHLYNSQIDCEVE